ncbi:MAG: GHKL domain-containing protein, partial [Bacteroidales bacterium]|nr:GHKL domain-containing protein [Bacteroidales bacterium]
SPLIPLEEELRLVEHYSYLMRVRFEDAFFIEIDLPGGTGSRFVPPLCVQMLIENAIKHNHMSQEIPLRISITSTEDYLVVRNNFIGDPGHVKIGKDLYKKPGQKESSGIGLQNIKNRYGMLSDKPVIISKDEYFTVSIPLIPANETKMVHT